MRFKPLFSFALMIVFSMGLPFSGFSQAKTTTAKPPVKKVTTVAKPAGTKVTPKPTPKKMTTPVKKEEGTRVLITTDMGNMVVRLYNATPLHRDNFISLVKSGFYKDLLFHRVIPEFMIQGGDPLSRNAEPNAMLGMGGGDMQRTPAEFRPELHHKRGVLAAARDGNPEKASSACQFYIVQGRKYSNEELNLMESQMGRKFTAQERIDYTTLGGTPFLDQNYTVFGEVESGFDVIDKIAATPRNQQDRPLKDVRMNIELKP